MGLCRLVDEWPTEAAVDDGDALNVCARPGVCRGRGRVAMLLLLLQELAAILRIVYVMYVCWLCVAAL